MAVTPPRIGSLFSGYGGLDMAVQEVFGGELLWWSDIKDPAITIMTAHHPNVPNLGNVKDIDWDTVPRIDILTGGYPCQPFSAAGKRKGVHDDRHLWPHVREAIRHLRPRLVVLENVQGHLSLGINIVIGELAELGYDVRWGVVRASEAGAPHHRARIFLLAEPHDASTPLPLNPHRQGLQGHQGAHREASTDGQEHPEPSAGTPDAGTDAARDPSPWGGYEPTIRRWEAVTRPAPAPVITEGADIVRMNPAFIEWMMGLPAGWVTGRGLRRAQEVDLLGNGVCPQQAAYALRLLLQLRRA